MFTLQEKQSRVLQTFWRFFAPRMFFSVLCCIFHFEIVLEKHCDEKTKNMGCNPKFILIFCYLRDHIIKKSRIQIKYV